VKENKKKAVLKSSAERKPTWLHQRHLLTARLTSTDIDARAFADSNVKSYINTSTLQTIHQTC